MLARNAGPKPASTSLFSNDPGSPGLRPPGLLAGVVALTPSAATGKGDAMVEDLTALAANVSVVAGGSRIVFVTHPAQAVGKRS